MRIPRLHVATPLAVGATVTLPERAARHAVRVLRLRVGDAVVLFDGHGGEYPARITRAGNGGGDALVESFVAVDRESRLDVRLGQGISRGERMDWVVQKATEAGVTHIAPVACARSVVRLAGERAERRRAHWEGIVAHASEQSGRTRVPTVEPIAALDAWLTAQPDDARRLTLSPDADRALRDFGPPDGPVTLLVGPEGGLEAAEIDAARRAGFEPVRLGPRTLRTETAAVAAILIAQTLWGDLG